METMDAKRQCRACGSERVVKFGKRNRKQCWLCRSCNVQFVDNPVKRGLDERERRIARNLMAERLSLRGMARVLEVSLNCIQRFVKSVWEKTPEPKEVLKMERINLNEDSVEIDEMWTFVGRRKKEHAYWICVAVHRKSRQVLAVEVGYRDADTIRRLWSQLQNMGFKGPVHTDKFAAYYSVIPKSQHVDDGKKGGTNIVEGLNTRWRARCSRLVREATSFSKLVPCLKAEVKFMAVEWNLSL